MLDHNFQQKCCTGSTEQDQKRDLDAEIAAVMQDLRDHPERPVRPVCSLSDSPGAYKALQKEKISLWVLLDWAVNKQLVLEALRQGGDDVPRLPTRSCDIPEYGALGVQVDVSAKGDMLVHEDAWMVLLAVTDALGRQAGEFWGFVQAGVLPRYVSLLPSRRFVPVLRGAVGGASVRDLLDMSGQDYFDYLSEAVPRTETGALDFAALQNKDVCVRYSASRKVCAWDIRQVGFWEHVILADSLGLCRGYERFISQMDAIFTELSTRDLRRFVLQGLGVERQPWLV